MLGYPARDSIPAAPLQVCNLTHFTAILPQFFSDPSIQKFYFIIYFSLEENSFTSFAVTRHTVRCVCSHLSCMSFVWQEAFLFLCSQNVVHF